MKIYFAKEISSAHQLILPYESKCVGVHGHNYKVEIIVEGSINKHGMVVDFNHLKNVVYRFDHVFLNNFMEQPTVENIVALMLNELTEIPERDNLSKITVRIWEDSESYAEDTWCTE